MTRSRSGASLTVTFLTLYPLVPFYGQCAGCERWEARAVYEAYHGFEEWESVPQELTPRPYGPRFVRSTV